MNGLEGEEQAIEDSLNNGDISLSEYNAQLRELYQCARVEAQDRAQDAYDDEMDNW